MSQVKSLNTSGFTLIELVVVIVILGILAATAAPKFINLKSDARAASIKALAASLNSAYDFVLMKKHLLGISSSGNFDDYNYVCMGANCNGIVLTESNYKNYDAIKFQNGYPNMRSERDWKVVADIEDYDFLNDSYGSVSVCFFLKGEAKQADCNATAFTYNKPASSDTYCHVQILTDWTKGSFVNAWTGGC